MAFFREQSEARRFHVLSTMVSKRFCVVISRNLAPTHGNDKDLNDAEFPFLHNINFEGLHHRGYCNARGEICPRTTCHGTFGHSRNRNLIRGESGAGKSEAAFA